MTMIKNVVYKELKLVVSPIVFLMGALSLMLMIPNYPCWVGVFYCFIAINTSFTLGRSNKDNEFSATLPIPRNYIVVGKLFNVLFSEAIQLIIAIPAAIVATKFVYPALSAANGTVGNVAGMDANFAFFGLVLIAYSVFNIVFLPYYFKSGYKSGIALLFGMLAFTLCIGVFELLINVVPTLKLTLDSEATEYVGWRLLVLGLGILIFAAVNYLTYRLSVKSFAKVAL